MAPAWRITWLKVIFPFPLSNIPHLFDSLHQSGCFWSTLMLQSSPQNKQCSSHLNFGTFDRLSCFEDNTSLEQLWLLSSLFKCLSICVFKLYVERQLFWVTKLSWFKLSRLLHKESFLSLFASRMEHHFFSEILCTSAPLWQLLKDPLNMHCRCSDMATWKVGHC